MKITPTQRFRDGRTTYEPDTEYDVSDLDGARFVGNGWATSPEYSVPGRAAPETAELEPKSTVQGQTESKGG